MYPINKIKLILHLEERKRRKNEIILKRNKENSKIKENPMDRGVTGIEYSKGAIIELNILLARIDNGEFDFSDEEGALDHPI